MRQKRIGASSLLSMIMLLIISAFGLLVFRDQAFDLQAIVIAAALCFMIVIHYLICTKLFPGIDIYILVIVYILTSISMIVQYRINPEIATKQLIWIGIGMIAMIMMMTLMKFPRLFQKMIWIIMGISLVLLVLVLLIGNESGGAKNWINLGPMDFQPSEVVKVALIIILAYWLSENQKILSLWPMFAFVFASICLLVIAKDLGAAVLYALTTLIVFYVATGNWKMSLVGLGMGAVGSVGAYKLFSHVRVRIAVWRNPWTRYGEVGGGYQIAQGLMAIASGGLFGMGLTRGMPKSIPAFRTDYIFAVVCEEMGIIVGLCLITLYFLLMLRGVSAAKHSKNRYYSLMALGVVTMITLQTFLIIGGVIKMIPLTGVTLPFVSYGGSSMSANFLLIGLLESVCINASARKEE